MLTQDRRKELEFYIRNDYVIMFSGGGGISSKNSRFYGHDEDIYTLSEIINEGYLQILDYDNQNASVVITPVVSFRFTNGVKVYDAVVGQKIIIALDKETNKQFQKEFFPDLNEC